MEDQNLTREQWADILVAFRDHPQFCRECLSIRDRIGDTVPLELEAGQLALHGAIEKQRKQGKPVRLVVLKTRRSYFTAGACAEIFHDVAFWPGRRATIIADHYKPAGLEAFDYLVQYTMSYRPFERHGHAMDLSNVIKPRNLQSPVSEGSDLQLLLENGSSFDVLSAEGGDVGRGGGRHWLLGDEVAFWRAATITLTAILNMIPDLPETGVILQSTANGVGGEFYDLCQKAMDPANEGGWAFLFFGWLDHAPYTMQLTQTEAVKLQASLDAEEKILASMHNATLGQLAWRRRTIAVSCRGDVELFHQEYPTTPEEAFLSSGRPVFDHKELARHPVIKGASGELEIVEQAGGMQRRMLFVSREEDRGSLTVWKKPERGRLYTIGADPSKGVDVSTAKRGENPDFSVAFVADTLTGEQVALYRARTRPGAFGETLAILARYYNWAFVCPEANDAGFIDAFVKMEYPLELIYNRERDPTDKRSLRIQEIGFETTSLSRSWLIGAGEQAIRDMTIQIHSSVVISECQTFVIKPNGKKEHQDDRHDDCVIALCLTEIGRRQAPRLPPAATQARPSAPFVQVGRQPHNRRWDED